MGYRRGAIGKSGRHNDELGFSPIAHRPSSAFLKPGI